MLERILVPVDGSLRAELILGQLGRILWRRESKVVLLRILDEDVQPLESAKSGYRRQERNDAEQSIADLAKKYSAPGIKVSGKVASGKVAELILKTAQAERSSMIAMTTHGRSGLSRWIMGSVAEKVVRAAPVPVLLVRSFREGSSPATAEEFEFRKILLPVDGSRISLAALGPALEMATLCKSGVVVLHAEFPYVLPGPEGAVFPAAAPTPSEKDEVTLEAAETIRKAGLSVSRVTEVGEPAGVILDQSRSLGVDLIVMATHGRSGIARWALGSVAERVLRHGAAPLLLVAGKPAARRTR